MKSIKNLLFLLFMAFGMGSFAQVSFTETEAKVIINGSTTREGLMQMRTELLTHGIEFEYFPQFDNNRKLVSIEFNVKANEGNLTGSGSHPALQTTGASVTFTVNKNTNQFEVKNK